MTRALLVVFALALAGLFVVVPACAHAATTTERALEYLCGPRGVQYTPHVAEAARRFLLHPVAIVALMHVESRCKPDAVSRKKALGLMQVLPYGPAANGLTRRQLRDPKTNIHAGARWLAMMATWCGSLPAGIGAYNTGKCERGKGFARAVLGRVARVWRALERKGTR